MNEWSLIWHFTWCMSEECDDVDFWNNWSNEKCQHILPMTSRSIWSLMMWLIGLTNWFDCDFRFHLLYLYKKNQQWNKQDNSQWYVSDDRVILPWKISKQMYKMINSFFLCEWFSNSWCCHSMKSFHHQMQLILISINNRNKINSSIEWNSQQQWDINDMKKEVEKIRWMWKCCDDVLTYWKWTKNIYEILLFKKRMTSAKISFHSITYECFLWVYISKMNFKGNVHDMQIHCSLCNCDIFLFMGRIFLAFFYQSLIKQK